MVSKISYGNIHPSIVPSSLEAKKTVFETRRIIPLVLFCHPQQTTGKNILLFKNPEMLSKKELCLLDRKTCHLAKLIIENDKHIIKLGKTTHELDFDEINYSFTHEGKEFTATHKKGEKSIEVMDDAETEEIQALFAKTINAKEESVVEKLSDDDMLAKTTHFTLNSKLNNFFSIVAMIFSASDRSSKKRREEARENERKLQEKEAVVQASLKRALEKREERWQQRQKHFEIKEENRALVLEQARKDAALRFEQHLWTIPPKAML